MIELAQEDVNQAGGVNANPLELRYADTRGEVAPAEKAVNDLVSSILNIISVFSYPVSKSV